jgi:hypothetical protein
MSTRGTRKPSAMRFIKGTTLVLGFAIGTTGALAQAPPGLRGKTISISFDVIGQGRAQEDGKLSAPSRHVQKTIYVSSQGRVFDRTRRQNPKYGDTAEKAPGEHNYRFESGRLVGVRLDISGASQLSVTFGQNFTTCTAHVIMGHESGKPRVFRGLEGRTYVSQGPTTVANETCSISQGNLLAN